MPEILDNLRAVRLRFGLQFGLPTTRLVWSGFCLVARQAAPRGRLWLAMAGAPGALYGLLMASPLTPARRLSC